MILTREERQAFDWVGDRCATGYEAANILHNAMLETRQNWEENVWDFDGEIEFELSAEQKADLRRLRDIEGGLWPCFSPELAAKLNEGIK